MLSGFKMPKEINPLKIRLEPKAILWLFVGLVVLILVYWSARWAAGRIASMVPAGGSGGDIGEVV